ncbi:hypothetical protein KJ903_02770 [Patescibacteria group bacterium]|nr:hypothetical protein [Patescibacteria group bacterium]
MTFSEGSPSPIDTGGTDFTPVDAPDPYPDGHESVDDIGNRMEAVRTQLLKAEKKAGKAFSRLGKLLGTSDSRTRTQEVNLMQGEYERLQGQLLQAKLKRRKNELRVGGASLENMSENLAALAAGLVVKEKKQYIEQKAEMEGTGWVRRNVIERYKKLGLKKKLLISGALLGGAAVSGAFGQVWLAGGLLAARRAIGTLGASIGTEALVDQAHAGELAKKGLSNENIFREYGDSLQAAAAEAARDKRNPDEAVRAVLEMAMRSKRVDLEKRFREQTKLKNRQAIRKGALVGLVGGLTGFGFTGEAFGNVARPVAGAVGESWLGEAVGKMADKTGLSDAFNYVKGALGFKVEAAADVKVTTGTLIVEEPITGAGTPTPAEAPSMTEQPLPAEASTVAQPIAAEVPTPAPPIQPEAGSEVPAAVAPEASTPTQPVPVEVPAPAAQPLPAEAPDPNAKIPLRPEYHDQELPPEAADGVLSKHEISRGNTLWGSVRELYMKNAQQLGFKGGQSELSGWANQQTGKALRELAQAQGGKLHDLVHTGDTVSIQADGKVVFENTSGMKAGVMSGGSARTVDADDILRQAREQYAAKKAGTAIEAASITDPPPPGQTGAYIDEAGDRRVVAKDLGGKTVNIRTEGYLAADQAAQEVVGGKPVPVYLGESGGKPMVFGQDPATGDFKAAPLDQPARVAQVDVYDDLGFEVAGKDNLGFEVASGPPTKFDDLGFRVSGTGADIPSAGTAQSLDIPPAGGSTGESAGKAAVTVADSGKAQAPAPRAEQAVGAGEAETPPEEPAGKSVEQWRGGAKFTYDSKGNVTGVYTSGAVPSDHQWRGLINKENLPENWAQRGAIELQAKQLATYQELHQGLQAKGMTAEADFVEKQMKLLVQSAEKHYGDVFKA